MTPIRVRFQGGRGVAPSALAFTAPGSGMRLVVDLRQVLKIQMRVDLGRADVRVAEQFLDGAQITTGLEHMTGEGVAQHVRMDRTIEPLDTRPSCQPRLDRACRQPRAAPADEERGLCAGGQGRALTQPVRQAPAGDRTYR